MRDKFNFRPFTALVIFWSFILETISGIVLYIVPPGRVANWTNWKLLGLSKDGWGAVHTIFGLIFLIFALIHIYKNWKPLLNYMKTKIKAGLRARQELALSLTLTLVVGVATVASVPPFSSIMDWGEKIKNSWEDTSSRPFIPHAELLSLRKFLKEIGVNEGEASKLFKEKGIRFSGYSAIIKDIADENGLSPNDIYNLLKPLSRKSLPQNLGETQPNSIGMGQGYGWKKVRDVAQDLGKPVDEVLTILKRAGIECREDEMLREVAERHGRKAIDLVKLISGEK
jgi:hypothetical protein